MTVVLVIRVPVAKTLGSVRDAGNRDILSKTARIESPRVITAERRGTSVPIVLNPEREMQEGRGHKGGHIR